MTFPSRALWSLNLLEERVRRWTDNRSDSTSTTSRLTGHRVTHSPNAPNTMGWELRRNRTALPDVCYGNKNLRQLPLPVLTQRP